MASTILAVLTSVVVFFLAFKTNLRYVLFLVSLLIFVPFYAYMVHGLRLVFDSMEMKQVYHDVLTVVAGMYSAPVEQLMGESVSVAMVVPGYLSIMATVAIGMQIAGMVAPSK